MGVQMSHYLVEGLPWRQHYLYHIWQSIIKRCYTNSSKNYHRYGGRGIGVCKRWEDTTGGKTPFKNFVADVHGRLGLRPDMNSPRKGDFKDGFGPRSCYVFGRKDHDRGYEPDNMNDHWETASESSNERITRNPTRRTGKFFSGVTKHKRARCWSAAYESSIRVDGIRKSLGYYNTPQDAFFTYAKAYSEKYDKPLKSDHYPSIYKDLPTCYEVGSMRYLMPEKSGH